MNVTGFEKVGVMYMKSFGSKTSLSSSKGGSRGGSKYRKHVLEAMTNIEETGKCVREYGWVTE
jgi:hypothetical protein